MMSLESKKKRGGNGVPLPDLNVRLICPECRTQPPNIIEEFAAGDLVCGDCGIVIGEHIVDTRSEWRTFANEDEDPSRVGAAANPLLEGSQLDTRISKRDGGSGLSRTLARAHGRSSGSKGERDLLEAYKVITTLCENNRLMKQVQESAKQIYKVGRENLSKIPAQKEDAYVAACIYMACRVTGDSRSLKEISALTHVPETEIGRRYKPLQALFNEKGIGFGKPSQFIHRFCSNLGYKYDVIRASLVVCEQVEKAGILEGRSPLSIAGAAISAGCMLVGERPRLRDIANEVGLTDTTIRSAYRLIYENQDKWVNNITDDLDFNRLMNPSSIFN